MFMDAADSLFVHAKARVITHTARKHKKIREINQNLILVNRKIRKYLCAGGEAVLKRLYNKMFKNPTTAAEPTETASFSEQTVRGEAVAEFPKDTDLPSSRLR